MIEQPNLDAKSPIGNGVDTVTYHEGVTVINPTSTADITNSSTNLNITASTENLSAKFKNPQNKQDKGITYSDQK